MSLQQRVFPRRENGTHEVAAKPSALSTHQPRAREQERKKGSLTSSLRTEPLGRSGKSRKSAKFRSISRSLILCNAKTSDDGSSPDERYPDPFEMSLGQGEEGILHSSVQLADTSEAGPGSIPDLALASEAAPLAAAGSDRGKACRKMFFTKESSATSSRGKPGKPETQSNFLFPKACHHRTRSNSTSVNPYCTGDIDFPMTKKCAVSADRQPYSLCSNRKSLSQQLDCPAAKATGTSRPTRSLSTAQLVQPSGGLQASVISNVVLMKGQAKGLGFSIVGGQDSIYGPLGFTSKPSSLEEQLPLTDGYKKEDHMSPIQDRSVDFPGTGSGEVSSDRTQPWSPGSDFRRSLIISLGDERCDSRDEILELNGESMAGLTHQDALQKFKQAKKGLLTLTVRTRLTVPPALCSQLSPPLSRSLSSSTCVAKDSSGFALDSPASPGSSTIKPNYRIMVEVSLKKEAGVGLGIGLCSVPYFQCISGIFVHTLSPGSVAHLDGRLRCGDEIVEINDTPVHCLTLNEVYAILSHCSPGPVPIIVSRHPDPQVSEQQLKDAVAQAVENFKFGKERHQWSLEGVKRLESSWHGRPTLEKEREKTSAPPHRRAQKVMIRSSSDSSYMSGSPGGSPSSGGGGTAQQPSDQEVSRHSPSPRLSQEPGASPPASSRPPQDSPRLPESPDEHPPVRLKKSFEIFVRKPTSSKPKPPPRKYFKSDSDPQKSLAEAENATSPPGHALPACSQEARELLPLLSPPQEDSAGRGPHATVSCPGAGVDPQAPSTTEGEPGRRRASPATQTSPLKHPLLKRQARMDYSFETTPEDPWVRISDCIKSLFSPMMSESHGHLPLQPHASLREEDGQQGHLEGTCAPKLDPAHGAAKVHKATDSGTGKKGPPVAPKPAWFRQSLKGLRNRASPAQPIAASSREPPGPHVQASSSSSSIKQRISSFETFGSSQLPDRGVQRLSLHASPGEAAKPSGKQEGGRFSGLLGRGAPPTAEPRQQEQHQLSRGSPAASEASDPGVSESPPQGQKPRPQPLPAEPDPLQRLLPSRPEASPGPVLKVPGQRARSFPLTRTQSCETKLLDEKSSKLYSISSQVSSAVMKSLLCLPSAAAWGLAPCSPREGVPPRPASREDPAPDGSAEAPASDSGFSLNLAELREYTEGLTEPQDAEDAAPCPQSGQSVISLLSSEELRKLIEEVRVLDEATLKQLDSIHVTILHKEEGAGLGFSLAGGADLENKVITVHRVFPHGLASQEGTIQKGNEVLSINGKSLKGTTHNDALAILRQARDPRQAVIVTRRPAPEASPGLSPSSDSVAAPSAASDIPAESASEAAVCTVTLEKTSAGLGFSLEGGRGSLRGDKPITINRIFKGAASGQSATLQPGDEILHVAGTAVQGLTRFEAWNIIKALPDGPVTVVIRRGLQPQGTAATGDP